MSSGKAARREAAGLLGIGRPVRVEGAARLSVSHAAGMGSRTRCEAHFARLFEESDG